MILETAVGREKDVHDIDVHGEYEKLVATLLVMRGFSDFPVMRHSGASRARLKAPTFGAHTFVIQLRFLG